MGSTSKYVDVGTAIQSSHRQTFFSRLDTTIYRNESDFKAAMGDRTYGELHDKQITFSGPRGAQPYKRALAFHVSCSAGLQFPANGFIQSVATDWTRLALLLRHTLIPPPHTLSAPQAMRALEGNIKKYPPGFRPENYSFDYMHVRVQRKRGPGQNVATQRIGPLRLMRG